MNIHWINQYLFAARTYIKLSLQPKNKAAMIPVASIAGYILVILLLYQSTKFKRLPKNRVKPDIKKNRESPIPPL